MAKQNNKDYFADFSSFALLETDELRKIVGGGEPTPEQVQKLLTNLSGIFVRDTSDRNMTDELWKEFYNEYSTLATTNVGYDLLSQIADSGKKIVVDDRGAYSNDDKQYHPEYQDGRGDSGGNLHLGGVGGLTVPDTSNPNANPYYELAHNFGLVAHKIYHADVYLTTGDPKEYSDSIRSELDAFIFEEMAEQEYDAARHLAVADLNKSYALLDDQVYDYNGGPVYSDSTIAFDTAWNDIFKNHNFSLENYNTLINTFQ